jgi:hypothetical protein
MPGTNYLVCEALPEGWLQSYPDVSDGDACPAGYGPYGYAINLESGEADTGNDFGNYQLAKIDGYKYRDGPDTEPPFNGQWDEGEPFNELPIEGWTIELWEQGGAKLDETTTDANGYFEFTDLMPGASYQIREVCPVDPLYNWYQTQPAPTNGCGSGTYDSQVPTSGETITVYFGNYSVLVIQGSGAKYHDMNANGQIDGGDSGLDGWTLFIDVNDNGILDEGEPSAVTEGGGTATFLPFEIDPGTYRMYEKAPASQEGDWTCSYPNQSGDADPLTGAVTSTRCYNDLTFPGDAGFDANSVYFMNWQPATKSGVKYNDVGNDGTGSDNLPETGDYPLPNFVIQLYYDGGTTAGAWDAGDTYLGERTTGADGAYSFEGLAPGSYLVCEETSGESMILSWPNNSNCAGLEGAEYGGYAFDLLSMELEDNNNFFNTPEIYGCTPGYWKNHQDRWAQYDTENTLDDVFNPDNLYDAAMAPYGGTSLIDALNFPGGSGVEGAKRILFRAAVSSLLNFTASEFIFIVPDYDGLPEITTIEGFKAAVIAALQSNDRGTILALATQLDEANNAVNMCPLSGTRAYKGT